MKKFTGMDGEVSRVDVTKFICEYIKSNNLQNPEDRRKIIPDTKLSKLLNLKKEDTDDFRYYNIQTHLSAHFPKK